jgi:hypothetical protein
MLIPFGVLSAAGAEVGGTYELIASEILGSATPSVTFSSLATYASTYKHLQIRFVARSSRTTSNESQTILRINGDTGSNYAQHRLLGTGSSVISQSATSITSMSVGFLTTAQTDASQLYASTVVDILDAYSATKNTTVRSLFGTRGTNPYVGLASGLYNNTSSITSLTLIEADGQNFVAGSRFSLYGIR